MVDFNNLECGDKVRTSWGEEATVSKYRYYGTMTWFKVLIFPDGDPTPLSAFCPADLTKI